ncbi:MAG: hypothetical protein KKH02_06010 [Proteobacteria bacterium]|nr:hypothetical protein [Pseudomonadota bacterium]MBU4581953.1 hypothetical protein [Pseudomonadota bacterium]MCG2739750.1 hypothetical protein [Syntrophaceae bacterium]
MAGLPIYLDLLHAMGLSELIGHHLQMKQRGWTDAQMGIICFFGLNVVSSATLKKG